MALQYKLAVIFCNHCLCI